MLKNFFNQNRQHVIIIALFLIISVAYCFPVTQGKVLNQNDDLSAGALNVEAEQYHKKTGEFIGWTNSMFSGMPTSVGYEGVSNYSINLIYALGQAFKGFSFDIIFWCLIGMYIMFCALGINPWVGALGSFIFAFSSFNILSIEAGHVQKMFNIALIPLLLGGVYLIFQKKYVWGFIAAAFGVNYQIGMGHYQITYYAALAAFVMCVFYGVKCLVDKQPKVLGISIGILLLAAVLGSLPNLSLLNVYYASHETTRGGASELSQPAANKNQPQTENKNGLDFGYATQWSYSPTELFTLVVPNAMGGEGNNLAYDFDKGGQPKPKEKSETYQALQQNVTDNNQYGQLANAAQAYWGEQPFVGGPIYFGAIVCFLALFGLVASKRHEKWWVLAIIVLFILLACGNHSFVYKLFFDYMPVFNKFRTPSMALSVVQIGFSLLAILGIAALFDATKKEFNTKMLFYVGGGVGVLLLIMAVSPGMLFSFQSSQDVIALEKQTLPDWLLDAMAQDRAALMKADALRSLVFVGLSFLAMWLFLTDKLKTTTILLITISSLVVIDLWSFNQRYLNKDNFISLKKKKSIVAASPADNQIKQSSGHYRVLNLASRNPFSDYTTSYHHHSIGGYHGAKLRKYQELIEGQITTLNPSVLSMLNTRFIIVDGGQQGPIVQSPIKNPMGNAWFVRSLNVVDNGDKEMQALNVDSVSVFDPAQTLVVQAKNLPANLKGFTANTEGASISLIEYAPHKLKYQSNAASDQVAVFSEIYYLQPDGDGWKALIDDKPAEHFRANYVLRAMKVPAGKHTIEFIYDASKSLNRVRLSFVFFALLMIISILALYLKSKGKLKAIEQ